MRDARPGVGKPLHLVVGEVHAVGAPDVLGEPAELVEVLDRAAAIKLAAIRLLLDGLREVRVERNPEAAGELRRLPHQLLRHREGRARRHGNVDAVSRQFLRLLEDRVDVLDQAVRRKSAVGGPEIHRATSEHQLHADVVGRANKRLAQPGLVPGKT